MFVYKTTIYILLLLYIYKFEKEKEFFFPQTHFPTFDLLITFFLSRKTKD